MLTLRTRPDGEQVRLPGVPSGCHPGSCADPDRRRGTSPRRAPPRSVWTLSPTCTRISIFSSISATAPALTGIQLRRSLPSSRHPWPVAPSAPWVPDDCDRRVAALRTAVARRADRAPLADRRRDPGADLARESRHPSGGRDAVQGGVVDDPSPAFERGFVQHHWLHRASWSPDGELNLMAEVTRWPVPVDRSRSIRRPSHRPHRIVARSRVQGHGLGKEMGCGARLRVRRARCRSPRRRRSSTTRLERRVAIFATGDPAAALPRMASRARRSVSG